MRRALFFLLFSYSSASYGLLESFRGGEHVRLCMKRYSDYEVKNLSFFTRQYRCIFDRSTVLYNSLQHPNLSAPIQNDNGTVSYSYIANNENILHYGTCGSSICENYSTSQLCGDGEKHVGGRVCCPENSNGYHPDRGCIFPEITFELPQSDDDPCPKRGEVALDASGNRYGVWVYGEMVNEDGGSSIACHIKPDPVPPSPDCSDKANASLPHCNTPAQSKAKKQRERAELARKTDVCRDVITDTKSSCEADEIKAREKSASGTQTASSTVKEQSCDIVDQINEIIPQVDSLATKCSSVIDSCMITCQGIDLVSECSSIRSTTLVNIRSQSSELASVKSSAKRTCDKLSGNESDSSNQNKAGVFGGGGLDGSLTSSMAGFGDYDDYGEYGSELGDGYSGSNSVNQRASGSYRPSASSGASSLDFGANGNLSTANGSGDDLPVFGSGNTGQSSSLSNPQAGQAGPRQGGALMGMAGNQGRALNLNDSNSKTKPNNRRRSAFRSAKERNLINGFKSVKASDGGAGISIRPADFKRFGTSRLKKKLADARKKHGKDLPLIFKNGKFVLDFLAMKELSNFKARTAAMERHMSGGSKRGTASIEDLPVHQNASLNIFKLMNFRYEKQQLPNTRSL